MAKLYHHRTDGTYYTRRFEDGVETRLIHPDGVRLLKTRGVRIGEDIPPFTMSELVARRWLYTRDEADGAAGIDWSLDWSSIANPPANFREWTHEPSGWSLLQAGDGGVSAISSRAESTRVSMWGVGAVLVVMMIAALLGMNLNG